MNEMEEVRENPSSVSWAAITQGNRKMQFSVLKMDLFEKLKEGKADK